MDASTGKTARVHYKLNNTGPQPDNIIDTFINFFFGISAFIAPVVHADFNNGYIKADNSPVIEIILPEPEPFKFYEPPKWTYRSCVEFAKYLTGHADGISTYGIAGRIKPNVDTPEVGEWVLTKEGPAGHVAVIVEIDSVNNWFRTDEANWTAGERTTRWLSLDDPKIRGFFKP